MIFRSAQISSRSIRLRLPQAQHRHFSNTINQQATNRIFASIRTPDELHTTTFLCATDNRPLITLWTASWCSTCQDIKPIVKSLIEEERVGEKEGGLGYAEVELDSTLIGDLGVQFSINSMPTLLAFSRQEAQEKTKLTRPGQMKDREFLRNWLLNEARRGGRAGGSGGSLFGGWFGGG